MRALVTGAGGFIGSRLVHALCASGVETFASVRPRADLRRLSLAATPAELVEADLRDAISLRALAERARPDIAFHLAWHIAADVHVARENLACLAGTLTLMRHLSEVGCTRQVFTGTYLEYAPSLEDLSEASPLRPRNLYATCKSALHSVAEADAKVHGGSVAWARLFNVYGPGEYAWPLIPFIIRHLLADAPCQLTAGDQIRGFMHVDDAAHALAAVGLSSVEGAVNVGAHEPVSVREVATKLGALTGRSSRLVFGARAHSAHDDPRAVADVQRLRADVGFSPTHTLDSGLAETVEYWRVARLK